MKSLICGLVLTTFLFLPLAGFASKVSLTYKGNSYVRNLSLVPTNKQPMGRDGCMAKESFSAAKKQVETTTNNCNNPLIFDVVFTGELDHFHAKCGQINDFASNHEYTLTVDQHGFVKCNKVK